MKFTPAATYALLLKQTSSLLAIIHCLEQQRDAWTTNYFASKQLDSQREANQLLTNENEQLQKELAQLDAAISELPIDPRTLPKDHPFRQSIRRYAGQLARKNGKA